MPEIQREIVPHHQKEALNRRLVETELLFEALNQLGIKAPCAAIAGVNAGVAAASRLRNSPYFARRPANAARGVDIGAVELRDDALNRAARSELHDGEADQHDAEQSWNH